MVNSIQCFKKVDFFFGSNNCQFLSKFHETISLKSIPDECYLFTTNGIMGRPSFGQNQHLITQNSFAVAYKTVWMPTMTQVRGFSRSEHDETLPQTQQFVLFINSKACSYGNYMYFYIRSVDAVNYVSWHWVTLSFCNTKVLHRSFTPNLKSNCWTLV